MYHTISKRSEPYVFARVCTKENSGLQVLIKEAQHVVMFIFCYVSNPISEKGSWYVATYLS